MRYVVTGPVKGGNEFWNITDTERDFECVSVDSRLPHAEDWVRGYATKLNGLATVPNEGPGQTGGGGTGT